MVESQILRSTNKSCREKRKGIINFYPLKMYPIFKNFMGGLNIYGLLPKFELMCANCPKTAPNSKNGNGKEIIL